MKSQQRSKERRQQRLENFISNSSDDTLQVLISQLPLNDIDEDGWETFLQSERINSLIDPILSINYNSVGNNGNYQYLNIAKTFRSITKLLKNIGHDDTFVWNILKKDLFLLDQELSSEIDQPLPDDNVTSISSTRALLLLLVQCICDGQPALAISASEMFLTLCRLPHAVENFFSPNLFLGQRMIHPFSQIISESPPTDKRLKKITSKEETTLIDELPSDEDGEEPSNLGTTNQSSSSLNLFSLSDLESLMNIITSFVSDITTPFLQQELGRELIVLLIDTIAQVVFRGRGDSLRENGMKCLLSFMRRLDSLRRDAILSSTTNEININVEDINNDTDSPNENSSSNNIPIHSVPLVPMYSGGPLGDLLLFGGGIFLRHVVHALVLGGRRVGTTITSVPKSLLGFRKLSLHLLSELISVVPSLLYPKELVILPTSPKNEIQLRQHIDDNSETDDIEHTARRRSKRKRKKVETEDEEEEEQNVIISDDDVETGFDQKLEQSKKIDHPEKKETKQKTREGRSKKAAEKQQADQWANDPILAVIGRACLTVADRKEWRELLSKAILEIIKAAEQVEKNKVHEEDKKDSVAPDLFRNIYQRNQYDPSQTLLLEPFPLRARVCYFVAQLTRSSKAGVRMIALDVSLGLLESFLLSDLPIFDLILPDLSWQMLLSVVCRVRDTQQGIRARSLECMASLLQTALSAGILGDNNPNNSGNVKNKLVQLLLGSILSRLHPPSESVDLQPFQQQTQFADYKLETCFIDLAQIIRDRSFDEKPIVRKSALTLLTTVADVIANYEKAEGRSKPQLEKISQDIGIINYNILKPLCLDSSLQVRVKALSTVHSLLGLFPSSNEVSHLWLDEILPSVSDPEKSVSERLIELVQQTVVEGLSSIFGSSVQLAMIAEQLRNDDPLPMPLSLLSIATADNVEYLQRSIAIIYKKAGTLQTTFSKALKKFLQAICLNSQLSSSQWPPVPFELIQEIITFQSNAISPRLICQCWNTIVDEISKMTSVASAISTAESRGISPTTMRVSRCLLVCLKEQAPIIPPEDKNEIAIRMIQLVESVSAPFGLIAPLVAASRALSRPSIQSSTDKIEKPTLEEQSWLLGLIKTIQAALTAIIQSVVKHLISLMTPHTAQSVSALQLNQSTLCRYLFTLGELAFTWNATIPSPLITLIEALATDTLGGALTASAASRLKRWQPMDETPIGPPLTQYQESKSRIQPTSRLSQGASASPNRLSIPEVVRGQAFLCLGKIAIRNEILAKRLIETFVGHLGPKEPPIVKNNTLVVFADLSLRFTSLTDPYIPQFSSCLADTSSLIRKQCLTLLAALVAQDYIKCKGLIVFRLLICLSDQYLPIRELAEAVTLNIIVPRQANFIQNHFLEMLCFMSGWVGHPVFRASAVGGASYVHKSSPFCLLQHPSRRQTVYQFFLNHMSDKDKHEVSRRLVHDFLAAFVDSDELTGRTAVTLPRNVNDPAGTALRDALKLLGCKQMKISFGVEMKRQAKAVATVKDEQQRQSIEDQSGEADEEEGQKAAYEMNLLKRNLAFQILPTLLSLKRMMEDIRSSFLRDILHCLSGLLYDYRNELNEVLFHDPMLAKQLETDFKKGLFHHGDFAIHESENLTANETQAVQISDSTSKRCFDGNNRRRGRPSLLLETSPRLVPSGIGLRLPEFNPSSRSRRSLDINKKVALSLPRLRAEAVAALTSKGDHQLCSRLVAENNTESARSHCRGSGTLSSVQVEQSPNTIHNKTGRVTSQQTLTIVPEVQLGRTEDEQAEQQLVLTALRSSRRRHSLPSVCEPLQNEAFELVGNYNETHRESPSEEGDDVQEDSELEVTEPEGANAKQSPRSRQKRRREDSEQIEVQEDPLTSDRTWDAMKTFPTTARTSSISSSKTDLDSGDGNEEKVRVAKGQSLKNGDGKKKSASFHTGTQIQGTTQFSTNRTTRLRKTDSKTNTGQTSREANRQRKNSDVSSSKQEKTQGAARSYAVRPSTEPQGSKSGTKRGRGQEKENIVPPPVPGRRTRVVKKVQASN